MDSGVYEIFGTRYYASFFVPLLVAPFVLWFFACLRRALMLAVKKETIKWKRLVFSGCCTFIVFVAVFWDVYQIGQEATKLCNEKAGLHVYRTVEAESFLGAGGIKNWAKYGFKFTEGEYDDGKFRYFYQNGKPTYKKVDKIISRYELTQSTKRLSPKIDVQKIQVKDRYTGELLGEAIEYSIDGGWVDMAFYGMTGFHFSPWICSGRDKNRPFYLREVVKATIKPIQKTN